MNNDADFQVPPANTTKLAAAGALLLVPIVALMWVDSYANAEPELFGFPFFIWYQFLWVFICSACTWMAFRLVQSARPRRSAKADSRERGVAR